MAWAPDYTTVEDLAAYVRIPDEIDNVQLALAITSASRAIDQATNRQFGAVAAPEARLYTARFDRDRCRWVVPVDDLMTSVGLLVEFDTVGDETYADEIDDYRLTPSNAATKSRPWTELRINPTTLVTPTAAEDAVQVTATWGWTEVPDAIVQATLLQASRFLVRRDSPFGIAGSPDTGSEMRLLAKVDPDVAVIIQPYTRRWAVAW
jgi:hypothetical protein